MSHKFKSFKHFALKVEIYQREKFENYYAKTSNVERVKHDNKRVLAIIAKDYDAYQALELEQIKLN